MHGVIFRYGPGSAQVAFRSSVPSAAAAGAPPRHLVLVGGLTDGLLALPYAPQLSSSAAAAGYELVQAQLSSSYQASLKRGREGEWLLMLLRAMESDWAPLCRPCRPCKGPGPGQPWSRKRVGGVPSQPKLKARRARWSLSLVLAGM
jgi:hypothetical protein